MGFLDKLKRAVTGPVSIEIDAPDTFGWDDGTLVIGARLTNATDQPLVASEVRATLEARQSNRDGSTARLKATVAGPIALPPGQPVDTRIELPLGHQVGPATLDAAAADAGLPSWAGRAMAGAVGEVSRRSGPHEVQVTVKLDGSARLSSADRAIAAR